MGSAELLNELLETRVKRGRLTVIYPDGAVREYGDGSGSEPLIVRLKGGSTPSRLAAAPDQALPEQYAQEHLVIEQGSLAALLDLLFRNRALETASRPAQPAGFMERAIEQLTEPKDYGDARGDAVMRYFGKQHAYEAFLGERRMQLSAGYAGDHATTAADLQEAGRRHIAHKLRIAPGQRVLDVGAGWGAFAIWLAKTFDVTVTGYTLGADQLIQARKDVAEAGLQARVLIEPGDFRKAEGLYDRVLAIGSFEHVGAGNYDAYFASVRDRLSPDGVALVHTTGRPGPPRPLNPWAAKHFFRGSHLPSLSEVTPAIERSRLWLTDLEVLRRHGERTIAAWLQTWGEEGAVFMDDYDDVDRRRWLFLLTAAEMAFRYGDLVTFELQLTRSFDTLSITRDYMALS